MYYDTENFITPMDSDISEKCNFALKRKEMLELFIIKEIS